MTTSHPWGIVQNMHTPGSYLKVASLSLTLAVASFGCDKLTGGEEEEAPGASPADALGRPLGDIELPVSLRSGDPEPTGAIVVEATTEQLRVGQTPIVALDRGKVADADQSNGTIPKLKKAFGSSTSTLALRMQANIPYETIALAMNTAKQSGINNVAFQVRQTGSSQKTGWIAINGFRMSSKAEDLPEIAGTEYKGWNEFTDRWQEVFDACRTSPSGNCAYVNENVAEGGTLRMELMASGRGINVNYFRRGRSREQEAEEEKKRAQHLAAKKEDFLQGRITEEEMVEILLLGHPSTYALFQFRYQEALKQGPSALGKVVAPICGGQKCPMILTADEITHLVRVVSMIGAAFPDGSPLPGFSFEMPWTERPKPEDLQEFIETQSQL